MLLSSAYLPPISYVKHILGQREIYIEKHEHFVKQTYRNRCRILGANGVLPLVIPLVNTHEKTPISEMRIAYKQNWQQQHWRSIESAYRNSPYFIYYADQLEEFYAGTPAYLFEYNIALLKVLLRLLKIETEILFTEKYLKETTEDHRYDISPKHLRAGSFPAYTQVFGEKLGFQSDLSIIDLLFNLGPESKSYLEKLQD
jgi:hypothetical protein